MHGPHQSSSRLANKGKFEPQNDHVSGFPPVRRAQACPYKSCNKMLLRPENWALHVDTHNGDPKPFLCPCLNCGERFLFKGSLALHMRTHFLDSKQASPFTAQIIALDTVTNFSRRRSDQDVISPSISSSYTPRKRKNSTSSAGSYSLPESGNTDQKAVCEGLPDFFEISQMQKHWRTGASILRDLKRVLPSAHGGSILPDPPVLPRAIESLSSATETASRNAKAWSAIGTTLSRHVQKLKSYSASHDISTLIQNYIEVLIDVLALWVRTIDPWINLPYDALPLHQKTDRFAQDRHDLSLLTQDYETGSPDEDAIHVQKNHLENAFKALVDQISIRSDPQGSANYAAVVVARNNSSVNVVGVTSSHQRDSSVARESTSQISSSTSTSFTPSTNTSSRATSPTSSMAPLTEKERLMNALVALDSRYGSEGEATKAAGVTDMLLSLSKKERAMCLFSTEYLKKKAKSARSILDSLVEDD